MEQSYIYKLLYSELQTELTFAIFGHRRTAPLVVDSKPLRQIGLPKLLCPVSILGLSPEPTDRQPAECNSNSKEEEF
jgi:hypothetical protein